MLEIGQTVITEGVEEPQKKK